MPKPVCEEGDVTVLWNHGIHADRVVKANKPHIIITNKKEKTCTLKYTAKPAHKFLCKRKGKQVKRQEFIYRNTTNVEHEMYDCTSNNWSHWNSNEKFKKKFGICTRKSFDRSSNKVNYTWNITNNTEITAV